MWPPSSGSSGSMLKRNRDRLKPATSMTAIASCWLAGMSRVKISPPTRAAPTTPIGESASRSPSPKAASHRAGILAGRAARESTASPTRAPIQVTESPKSCLTMPVAALKPRKPAVTYSPWTICPLESFLATWLVAIFAVRVTSWPPRSTTIGTSLPGLARIRSESLFQSSVRTPSKATIRSPAFRPAAAAGEAASPFSHLSRFSLWAMTHCETELTLVVCWEMPKPISTVRNRPMARTRFMNGPANITMTRFHGLRV